MEIKPIRTEEDYQEALIEIEAIFDAQRGTPEGEKLEILTVLIKDFEKRNHRIPLPDPIDAIKFYMDRLGLSRRNLESLIGNRARVSEILNKKRPLTLRMMRNLNKTFGIPLEILIQEYPTLEGPYDESNQEHDRKSLILENPNFNIASITTDENQEFKILVSHRTETVKFGVTNTINASDPSQLPINEMINFNDTKNELSLTANSGIYVPNWPTFSRNPNATELPEAENPNKGKYQ